MTGPSLRVATYGYFGMGNIGNEGSLTAFLGLLRERYPHADVTCFAADPEAVRREHGIAATRLMAFRPSGEGGGLLVNAVKAVSRLWDVPRTFAMTRDVDVLVMPGTGPLETSLNTSPLGLPYWLFLAALSCRLRRRKVALVSIGAEYADNPATRWLYRWTVRLSDYCSLRDEASRDAVRAMGVRRRLDGVFPDLAFALPAPPERPQRAGHVVVGVMEYDGSPDDPRRGPAVVRAYVDKMSRLLTRLTDQGCTATLVVGDVADLGLSAEIEEAVRSARPSLPPDALSVSPAGTMHEIMAEMAEAQVVVASRFHNLICALKLARPTVSLGYAGKSARLMEELGLGDFCQRADDFDVDRLVEQVAEVQKVQPSVETHMKETLRGFEEQLSAQLDQLSRKVLAPAARRRREDRRGALRGARRGRR
jgi:polysaccharide pyruvyl transferase WcaK-like protein